MIFSYSAKSKNGDIVEGVLDMPDRFSAAKDLRSKGLSPVSVTEKGGGRLGEHMGSFEDIFSKVSNAELIIFTKNLSGMIKAGLSLSRALSVLKKQTKNKKLAVILVSISNEIDSGGTFSSALSKFPKVFSKLFSSMVRAGEESGNLSGALSEIGINLEKAHSLNKKVKGALTYPGVIMGAMVVIGILMFAFVVPTLAGTFKELGVTLPTSTRVLIFIGNFFSQHLLLSFLIVLGIAGGMFFLFRAKFMSKYIDYVILKIPAIGTMAQEINTARTARTISSLLSSGVSIVRAVEITGDVVQNIYYKRILQEAKEAVEKGAPFSSVFEAHPNLYPVMMSEMVEVGEETGKLADMLLQIALYYEEEIENKTKNLSTIIEPVLMIFIGAGVGFFAISMISPLYSILGNIG